MELKSIVHPTTARLVYWELQNFQMSERFASQQVEWKFTVHTSPWAQDSQFIVIEKKKNETPSEQDQTF